MNEERVDYIYNFLINPTSEGGFDRSPRIATAALEALELETPKHEQSSFVVSQDVQEYIAQVAVKMATAEEETGATYNDSDLEPIAMLTMSAISKGTPSGIAIQ